MEALARQLTGKVRLIGVSLSSQRLQEYVAERRLRFPIYLLDPEMADTYGLSSTPTTIVVGSDGIVRHSWQGAYSGTVKKAVENALGVALPEDVSTEQ